MAKTSNRAEPGSYGELAKLLALLARRGTTQTAFIYELANLEFEPKRIAELVGTTPNAVSVTLYQRKKGKITRKHGAASALVTTVPVNNE